MASKMKPPAQAPHEQPDDRHSLPAQKAESRTKKPVPQEGLVWLSGARIKILCIAGPTASGKSARAVEEALKRGGSPPHQSDWCGGEVISVDSRQVYRGLDIGAEKITAEEMKGVPHHLIDVRDASENYSAGDFVQDAKRLIAEIHARGKLPILVGGTHFYFDALLNGLPLGVDQNTELRLELETLDNEELYARVLERDPHRAQSLDPKNKRRLVRALEIIEAKGKVPAREAGGNEYEVEWIVINPPAEELRKRLDEREALKFPRGLIEEVKRVRAQVGDARLNELGLEYRIVGEFLRGERTAESLLPALSSKLWQYVRRQRAWLRKLEVN